MATGIPKDIKTPLTDWLNPFEEAADDAYEQLGSFRSVIEKDLPIEDVNPFRDARKLMAKRLAEDEGLRETYRANIAMLIHDNQTSEPYYVEGTADVIGQPYDLSNVHCCNAIAEQLIRLIFDN